MPPNNGDGWLLRLALGCKRNGEVSGTEEFL